MILLCKKNFLTDYLILELLCNFYSILLSYDENCLYYLNKDIHISQFTLKHLLLFSFLYFILK